VGNQDIHSGIQNDLLAPLAPSSSSPHSCGLSTKILRLPKLVNVLPDLVGGSVQSSGVGYQNLMAALQNLLAPHRKENWSMIFGDWRV